KSLVLIGFILSFTLIAHAQSEGQMLPIIIQGKDTIITCTLQEVVVVSKRTFKNPIEQAQFNLLKKNILIVYPYAKEAGQLYRDINEQMQAMDKKKERKKFVKQKEQELDE